MNLITLDKRTADDFYGEHEHLGNCGLGVWHFGLERNNNLISVVSYGTTCFSKNRGYLGKIAHKEKLKIIQLCRGGTIRGIDNHIPTKIISLSLKEIRKNVGDSIVVAYSDTTWNEIGTIYQASNFHYLGLTDPGGQANYIIHGKMMSGWLVRKKYGTRNIEILRKIDQNISRIPLNQKHRYLFINTGRIKRKFVTRNIQDKFADYPKRNELKVGSMLPLISNHSGTLQK